MNQPTVVFCSHCGTPTVLPFSGTMSFADNDANLVLSCPRGHRFDAAPGDGTYATVNGRLMRVADELTVLARQRPSVQDELHALRLAVERLGEDASQRQVEEVVVRTAPTAAPLLLRLLRDPATQSVLAAVAIVLGVLFYVLGG